MVPEFGDNFELVYDAAGWRGDALPGVVLAAIFIRSAMDTLDHVPAAGEKVGGAA